MIMDKLRKHNYYVRPTILKAVRTSKAGWMYLAHPDLTHRREFDEILQPLIMTRFNQQIEFQVSPENEHVDTEKGRISQRVLVVRSAYEDIDRIRIFFTEAFSPDSSMEIGFLARYTFVPAVPVGNCTKNHLAAFMKMQQQFHKNVFWYNWVGIRNVDQELPLLPAESSGTQDPQSAEAPQTQEQEDMENEEMEDASSPDPSVDVEHKGRGTPSVQTEKASLKRVLYEIANENGEPLIHAVYPSMDASKLYVLCSDKNKDTTLEHLQKIESVINQVFAPGATEVYFNLHEKPSVQNFPVLTENQNSLVDSIISLTSNANPQEEMGPGTDKMSFAAMVSQSPQKRLRNGNSKPSSNSVRGMQGGSQAHVTFSNLPPDFLDSDKDDKTLSTLNDTLDRLKQIEDTEYNTKESLVNVTNRLDQQAQDISMLGKSMQATNKKVDKVCETQMEQGNAMNRMDGSLQAILGEMQQLNKFNSQFANMQAESLQGGGVKES